MNPFRGSVQADAWGARDGDRDLASIHRGVFEKCREAVEFVRSETSSAGIVIHGEAGSGKTHLISRLRRSFTDRFCDPTLERFSQAFAYVQLNTHYSSLKRHTRRCVANDLLRSFGGAPTQLERLAISRFMNVAQGGGHLASWWEYLLEERQDEIDDLLVQLGSRENLSPDLVAVLGHVIRKRHRLEVAGWLRGDQLTDSAYDRLGVAPPNPDDDPEQLAQCVLNDLMRLAGPEVPLVICFDQVEALQISRDDLQPFFAYAQLIVDLYNADRNLVLISCMQTEFAERFKQAVPDYAHDRMRNYAVCPLLPLNREQAIQLLGLRLGRDSAGRPAAVDDLVPISGADLDKFLGRNEQCSPRHLLDSAARRYDQLTNDIPATKDLGEWMSDEWERRTELATRSNTPEQSEQILRDGIPRLLHVVDFHWSAVPGTPGTMLDYLLTGPQNEAHVGVKICEGENAQRLWRPLQTLDKLYPEKFQPKLQKLVILRDERSPIRKTAAKTIELIDSLEKKDALFFRVPPGALAALDALRKLLADSQAGDLDFEGETIAPNSLVNWLREHLNGTLRELADVFLRPSNGDWSGTPQVERLQEFLSDRRIASVDLAADHLQTSSPELVDAARARPDLFGVIDGEPSVVFSVRLAGPCIDAQYEVISQ